jgi:hypothetical protein
MVAVSPVKLTCAMVEVRAKPQTVIEGNRNETDFGRDGGPEDDDCEAVFVEREGQWWWELVGLGRFSTIRSRDNIAVSLGHERPGASQEWETRVKSELRMPSRT